MIEINKYKLTSLVTPWGEISGDIRDQKDLVAFIQERSGVTMEEVQEWVDAQGFLTEHQDLSEYAKKTDIPEVPSLDGYATEEWVEGKGYLTEHQDLSEYAKKSELPVVPTNVSEFTNDAGYLTEHQALKTINGESIVGEGDIEIHGGEGGVTMDEVDAEIDTKLDGYATETWVEGKGYLTEHQDLSDYAKKSELPSLDGYATEEYVGNELKNYVDYTAFDKNISDINDALKNKLEDGDFKTINGESIVGKGDIEIHGGEGGLTPEQEDAIAPLMSPQEGYLHASITVDAMSLVYSENDIFDGTTAGQATFNVDDEEVFYISRAGGNYAREIYKFNFEKLAFEHWGTIDGSINLTRMPKIWKEQNGEYFFGNQYMAFRDGKRYLVNNVGNIGGEYLSNYTYDNIFKIGGDIYMVSLSSGTSYKYDPMEMRFVKYGGCKNEVTTVKGTDFYRYTVKYNGEYYIIYNNQCGKLVLTDEGVDIVSVEAPFPLNIVTLKLQGGFILPVGDRVFAVYNSRDVIYELVDGVWELANVGGIGSNQKFNSQGCVVNDIVFGHGYDIDYYGTLNIINLTDNKIGGNLTWEQVNAGTDRAKVEQIVVDTMTNKHVLVDGSLCNALYQLGHTSGWTYPMAAYWTGTQAEYDALGIYDNIMYIIL